MKLKTNLDTMVKQARAAAYAMVDVPAKRINKALQIAVLELDKARPAIKKANHQDLIVAKKGGMSAAFIDRLTLSDTAIDKMVLGLKTVSRLPSPVGAQYDKRTRPNGLVISKVRCPIGVIAIIYESRPNVTIDSAALCVKSQNAVILRGGSDAIHSNIALITVFQTALKKAGLPPTAVQLVHNTNRSVVSDLLKRNDMIDLVIPRGGEGLIRTVVEQSRIPVIKHYTGVCHTFVSRFADMTIAVPLVINAKVQRPGVCNAMETLLIDQKLSVKNQRRIIESLIDKGVTLFGTTAVQGLSSAVKQAKSDHFGHEFLDLTLAVKTVPDIQAAIDHINTFGSHHTDAILSQSKKEQELFTKRVDSASVMVNTSTRFSDGAEYGLGCEIGISTDKLHARGPMGIEELTTYKWIVLGKGQVRK